MPRAIWSGSLSFGLVNVPVKVVSAVSQKEIRFNQIHGTDGGRIEMKRFCTAGDHEVPYDEIVKGYPIGGEEFVTIAKDELAQLSPERSETIDIEDFVDLAGIDPIYFEKPYYLVPDRGGAKAYRLLVEAMRATGRVAVGRVVMRTHEYLVAIRPVGKALAMTTMNHGDEIVDVATLDGVPEAAEVAKREMDMAKKLIEAMATDFDPSRYTDEYREQVLALIEAKVEGREIVAPPSKRPEKARALVDALQASIDEASRKRHPPGAAKA